MVPVSKVLLVNLRSRATDELCWSRHCGSPDPNGMINIALLRRSDSDASTFLLNHCLKMSSSSSPRSRSSAVNGLARSLCLVSATQRNAFMSDFTNESAYKGSRMAECRIRLDNLSGNHRRHGKCTNAWARPHSAIVNLLEK
jgi:hypothetical protein